MIFNEKIILASGSPRRKELLEMIGMDFDVMSSDFEEMMEGDGPQLAKVNALGKAMDVSKGKGNVWVLGADTVVVVGGEVLGKPKDDEDALRMLRLLSGSEHEVITGVALVNEAFGRQIVECSLTKVFMEEISESDMIGYVECGEGKDKASGYAIQGIGSVFIERIEGDYFNVVGLPMNLLKKMFKEV